MKHHVTIFKTFPFKVGQKIRIENHRRAGDWEVESISEHTVSLRCPISGKVFEWNKFCYLSGEEQSDRWPTKD
ncbi:MAG: hypothetical protein D6B25_18655 [Desulfobulbaceae bacterium]|nr:MAG: hypothetical protein D6B25_18655 [Desulfobulbaceae bacterium]